MHRTEGQARAPVKRVRGHQLDIEPILLDIPEELSGERVLVRPYEPSDTPDILAGVLQSQPELGQRLRSMSNFNALDDARRVVARSRGNWLLREDFVAGVFRRLDSVFCGGISLHPINWDYGKFEIGYWLCLAARGKGYATEAVRLMSDCAFEHLHAQRVEIVVQVDNPSSCRVADRAGFVLEGTLRRHLPAPDGTLKDVHVYSRLAS